MDSDSGDTWRRIIRVPENAALSSIRTVQTDYMKHAKQHELESGREMYRCLQP